MAKPTRLTQEMIEEYVAKGLWVHKTIPDLLKQNAERFPHKEALVDSERRYTWEELDRVTDSVASALTEMEIERDLGLVAQLPPITAISVVVLLACHKAGILCCLAPLTFRHKEMRHVIEKTGAVAALTPVALRETEYFRMMTEIAGEAPALKHLFVIGEDIPTGAFSFESLMSGSDRGKKEILKERVFGPFEVSSVVLSSGTTGMPKCIEQTGASHRAGGRGIVERARLTEEDVVGIIAPLSGGPGLQNFWAAFQTGCKVCLLERFTPDNVLQFIERERVTYLPAIPTQLVRIVKECDPSRYDLCSLRVVRTGAAAFDAAMARETEEKLGCTVLIAGGSQETYSFGQSAFDDPREKRLTTLGKPFPGNEVKIVDDEGKEVPVNEVGQLCVRGAATSSGYLGDEEATLAAWGCFGKEGWYRTGDLAKIDPEGYLVIAGRKKDMIIRGGQNIYPAEIESLLVSHPNVAQAVIVAIPDEVMGERACACVVPVPSEKFTFTEMTSFLKGLGLAVHKLPERLEVMEQFPQLVDGQKVDKISLSRTVLERVRAEDKGR
ncbi:MAG: AMP-binding protein [Desulfobacterales bacterium]|nr:AMP-binding protein [Desulfobacterales bacterium]